MWRRVVQLSLGPDLGTGVYVGGLKARPGH